MGGGTEAFPDLGSHFQLPDCHQLDFIPFSCHACHITRYVNIDRFDVLSSFFSSIEMCRYFAQNTDHTNPIIGSCKVVVCEICSHAIETNGDGQEENPREARLPSLVQNSLNKRDSKCPYKKYSQKHEKTVK